MTCEGLRRVFRQADQATFANLSGDRNPIHMDPESARCTIAGGQTVHGIHLLIWALDALVNKEMALPPLARVRVRFTQFVLVEEEVEVAVVRRRESEMRLQLCVGGAARCELALRFGAPRAMFEANTGVFETLEMSEVPLNNAQCSFEGIGGRVPFVETSAALAELYHHAARWLGSRRLSALAAASCLVGMFYPGLYAILVGLDVEICEPEAENSLQFIIGPTRHGLNNAEVTGGGLRGALSCMQREMPLPTPS